LIFV
jgi:hypothetical protein